MGRPGRVSTVSCRTPVVKFDGEDTVEVNASNPSGLIADN
jgi:hypothetical protein